MHPKSVYGFLPHGKISKSWSYYAKDCFNFKRIRIALFAILKPITPMEGVGEDEAIVFAINEEDETLDVVTDEALATAVFTVYDSLFEDEEEE